MCIGAYSQFPIDTIRAECGQPNLPHITKTNNICNKVLNEETKTIKNEHLL